MERREVHEYDPDCPDCVPRVANPVTLAPLPDDHPVAVATRRTWAKASLEVRQRYMRFTNGNLAPENRAAMEEFLRALGLEVDRMKGEKQN